VPSPFNRLSHLPSGRPRLRGLSPPLLFAALALPALLFPRGARSEGAQASPDGAHAGPSPASAPPMALPEVEIVDPPPAPAPRAKAAQTSVVEVSRFAGEARSVAELLSTAPGVTLRQTGPGQLAALSLRGASADESLVLLDGIPLQGPGGGAIDLSTLPSSLLEKMVVSRGVLGAQLGAGALGGAVQLVPREPSAAALDSGHELGISLSGGSFGTAQLAADASATSAKLGTWTAGVQLDRTAGDFDYARQFTPDVPGSPWYAARRQNDDSQRASALVHGAIPLREGTSLDLLLQATAGDRGLPGAEGSLTPDARSADRGGLVGARLRTLAGDAVVTTRAWVRASLLQLRGLGLGFGDCSTGLANPACATQASHTIGSRGEVEVALPLGAAQVLTSSLSAGGEWLAGDDTGIHRRGIASLALADEATLFGGRLSLYPAARLDAVGSDTALSPGLGAVLRPFTSGGSDASPASGEIGAGRASGGSAGLASVLEALELRASAGASFRPPSFSELYLDQGPSLPNPDLKPERAVSADLGLGWRTDSLTLVASAFWSDYTDLILYEQFPPEQAKPFNIGAARITGAELQAVARLPLGLTAEASYSYLHAINRQPTQTELGQELPYRPPHRLFARLARRGDRLEGFFQGDVTSAMPRNSYGTAALPAQVRLDAGVGVRAAGPVWIDLEARNLLDDRTQADLFQYPLPGLSFLATARARF
jgi:vitamin B12 transporter